MTLLLLLLAALIQLRGEPLAGGTVSGSAELPLERAAGGDTPVLPLQTPRGQLRLLLDTGATSTMVTPQLVQRLGLSSRELSPDAFALAGGGRGCGDLRPRRSRLPELMLVSDSGGGSLRMRDVEALVLPAGALPPGVDGVLGAPTLRQQPIWIDPQGGRLAIGAAALRLGGAGNARRTEQRMTSAAAGVVSSATGSSPRSTERLQLRWHQGVPLIGLSTPVGLVRALADTGAEGLFVSTDLGRRLPVAPQRQALRLVGFCGEQAVEQTTVAGLHLAGFGTAAEKSERGRSDQATTVILTDNPIFRDLAVEAIVGQELLRQRRQLWRLDLDPPELRLE